MLTQSLHGWTCSVSEKKTLDLSCATDVKKKHQHSRALNELMDGDHYSYVPFVFACGCNIAKRKYP